MLETSESSEKTLSGPAWNNSTEYPSIASNEFANDWAHVESLIEKLKSAVSEVKPFMERDLGKETPALSQNEKMSLIKSLQDISAMQLQTTTIIWNLSTFINCERSVDAKNAEAQKKYSSLMELRGNFQVAVQPVSLFLSQTSEETLKSYLSSPHTSIEEFSIRKAREWNDTLLSEPEESLLIRMRLHGIDAWGDLYNQISGNLKCQIEKPGGKKEEMGLAKASGLLRDADEAIRKSAWQAIQSAWKTQAIPCASILNGLAGWRLEVNKRRSYKRPIHFLDSPLHGSRIKRETLEAMHSAIEANIEIPRRALRTIAKGMGKNQIDPWDLMAPAPIASGGRRSFHDGMGLIKDAFSSVDSEFGEFAEMMEKNNWIEGRVLPNKRQGAYCTGFPKSRTPRVYQTYMGSISDIRTLAHELGHAYHSWVMRDLPLPLQSYPMTLAETASVFAETVFADKMSESPDKNDRFEIAWQNAETAAGFLINIPARFEFEKNFYEKRSQSGAVSAEELNDITETAWRKWYGDTLSEPERQFWMTKLHFSIAGVSFYNYPYSFGYLFSLGIYALRAEKGESFMAAYKELLRDTGRMTAEDLAMKHMGEDLSKPDFWNKSLQIVARQVEKMETLMKERESGLRSH